MPLSIAELKATQREADRIIRETVTMPSKPDTLTTRVDAVVLHPVFGLVILGLILPTQVRTLQVTPR
jgi:ferrous iron transport protein B